MKTKVHFTDKYLLQPTNPVMVNLIGAGGTGSQVLTALARMNQSLMALQHPGLMVRVFDDDTVTEANLGRQLFTQSETGLNKAVALINRLNRFFGTNWKAIPYKYSKKTGLSIEEKYRASITISCVDTVEARFEIAEILRSSGNVAKDTIHQTVYWMDFGNSRYTGQVILSTIGNVSQPASRKFIPVENLPFITDEFKDLLQQSGQTDDTPSCSFAEALTKQDLFINSVLANMGASLLWQLFREGMITNRGFFVDLSDFRTVPVKVG